jgi:uracil-DNA glycosylase family 4
VAFRAESRRRFPAYHSAPVPAFGDPDARLLVVGLAPGLHGANRTGRPFTGDHAGLLLYSTLHRHGLATASVSLAADDPLQLIGVRITNAVKCVPPGNRPTPRESRECNAFLVREFEAAPRIRAVLALGRVAHEAVLRVHSIRASAAPFGHGRVHRLPQRRQLVDSYHCSRYNTQTRRLTEPMFDAVVSKAALLAREGEA